MNQTYANPHEPTPEKWTPRLSNQEGGATFAHLLDEAEAIQDYVELSRQCRHQPARTLSWREAVGMMGLTQGALTVLRAVNPAKR